MTTSQLGHPPAAPAAAALNQHANADEKRQRILRAARAICARLGVDGTRMEGIAAEARVSKGTLYNYFDNKESLIVACVVAEHDRISNRVEASIDRVAPPFIQITAMVDTVVEVLPEITSDMMVHFQAWGLAVQRPASRLALFSALRANYAKRTADLEALVREGQARGEFARDAQPEPFTRSFFAILDGFVYRSSFDPEGGRPEQLRSCLQVLIEQCLEPRSAPCNAEESQ